MKRLSILAVLFLAASCVYPFNPDVSGDIARRLVVSGDILIGEQTEISLSYVIPISASPSEVFKAFPFAELRVECNKGQVFPGEDQGKGKFLVDTRLADPSAMYRLWVKDTSTGHEYVTPWTAVHKAPEITSLTFESDAANVSIILGMKDSDTGYYRWEYREDWEYHADFLPELMYTRPNRERDRENPEKIYRYPTPDEKFYYCWNSSLSTKFQIASTSESKENSVSGKDFLDIPRTSTKLSVLYSILVKAKSISSDAYKYFENVQINSSTTGNLFAPIPSDIRGNIRCTSDTTEIVIGYVEVSEVSSRRLFIDEAKELLYINNENPDEFLFYPFPDEDGLYNFDNLYGAGNAPVRMDVGAETPTQTNVMWAPKRCTDCRLNGGTKDKPDFWPNDHE